MTSPRPAPSRIAALRAASTAVSVVVASALAFGSAFAWPTPPATEGPTSTSRHRTGEPAASSLTFVYANDFFAGRDRYFTQRIGLLARDPAIGQLPTAALLPTLPGADTLTVDVLDFRYDGFTPTDKSAATIQTGDRPFATYFAAGHRRVSTNSIRGVRLTAQLDIDLIGQGTGGRWVQDTIHKVANGATPRGWHNQIRNDLILDYDIRIERVVVDGPGRLSELVASAGGRVGLLRTHATGGVMLRFGRFRRLVGIHPDTGWLAYLELQPELRLVGHDATLTGGLINGSSPHTVGSRDVERAVVLGRIGAALEIGRVHLRYDHVWLTREIAGGGSHAWGQLAAGWRW